MRIDMKLMSAEAGDVELESHLHGVPCVKLKCALPYRLSVLCDEYESVIPINESRPAGAETRIDKHICVRRRDLNCSSAFTLLDTFRPTSDNLANTDLHNMGEPSNYDYLFKVQPLSLSESSAQWLTDSCAITSLIRRRSFSSVTAVSENRTWSSS